MLLLVVIALIRLGNLGILRVVAYGRVSHRVAVMMRRHIRLHIRLIVRDNNRSRMTVIGRIMVPVPRRRPRTIFLHQEMAEDLRRHNISRFNNIVRTVDIRSTDNLNIGLGNGRHLCYHGSHILIDISRQYGLNKEHVCITVHGLQHTQIIYITVTVQIQVRQHVIRVIQQRLKLLYSSGLRKSSTYRLQVQIQRYIRTDGGYLCRRYGAHLGSCNRCRVIRRSISRSSGSHHRSRCSLNHCGLIRRRRDRHDTCQTTAAYQRQHCQEKELFFHIKKDSSLSAV